MSVLGAALVLTTSSEALIAANFRNAQEGVYAADAALGCDGRSRIDSRWNPTRRVDAVAFVDGLRARSHAGGWSPFDLAQLVNMINCRKVTPCSASNLTAITRSAPGARTIRSGALRIWAAIQPARGGSDQVRHTSGWRRTTSENDSVQSTTASARQIREPARALRRHSVRGEPAGLPSDGRAAGEGRVVSGSCPGAWSAQFIMDLNRYWVAHHGTKPLWS